jgi:hypothetical protein
MGFLPSKYQLTVQQANWIFAIIGRAGLAGEILWDQMDPEDKLALFECRYGQLPKSHKERQNYEQTYQQILAQCELYRGDEYMFLPYSLSRTLRIREMVNERETLQSQPRPPVT